MSDTVIMLALLAAGYVLGVLSLYIGVRLGRRQVIVRPDGTCTDTGRPRPTVRIARQAGRARTAGKATTTPPPRGQRITLPGGRERYL